MDHTEINPSAPASRAPWRRELSPLSPLCPQTFSCQTAVGGTAVPIGCCWSHAHWSLQLYDCLPNLHIIPPHVTQHHHTVRAHCEGLRWDGVSSGCDSEHCNEDNSVKEGVNPSADCSRHDEEIHLVHIFPGSFCHQGKHRGHTEGDGLFSRVCWGRTQGDGCELKEGRFRVDIRKKGWGCAGTGHPERW